MVVVTGQESQTTRHPCQDISQSRIGAIDVCSGGDAAGDSQERSIAQSASVQACRACLVRSALLAPTTDAAQSSSMESDGCLDRRRKKTHIQDSGSADFHSQLAAAAPFPHRLLGARPGEQVVFVILFGPRIWLAPVDPLPSARSADRRYAARRSPQSAHLRFVQPLRDGANARTSAGSACRHRSASEPCFIAALIESTRTH